jgi:hypothetical protein
MLRFFFKKRVLEKSWILELNSHPDFSNMVVVDFRIDKIN